VLSKRGKPAGPPSVGLSSRPAGRHRLVSFYGNRPEAPRPRALDIPYESAGPRVAPRPSLSGPGQLCGELSACLDAGQDSAAVVYIRHALHVCTPEPPLGDSARTRVPLWGVSSRKFAQQSFGPLLPWEDILGCRWGTGATPAPSPCFPPSRRTSCRCKRAPRRSLNTSPKSNS
jgi:hypothetical protein